MENAVSDGREQQRYRLYAFVCSYTCVKRVADPPPTATFAQIYQQRPADCRYAVAGTWDARLSRDRFIVWDLFDASLANDIINAVTGAGSVRLLPPKPRLSHDDLDAAIMATVLLYNKEVRT